MPLLIVAYVLNYLDRNNLGFAALTMNRELGLTATQFGRAARDPVSRLLLLRGAEQHRPVSRRSADLARADHDFVGADFGRRRSS